jgi:hypothetical protein
VSLLRPLDRRAFARAPELLPERAEEIVLKRLVVVLVAASAWLACSASGDRGAASCAEGETQSCTCENGAPGLAKCNGLGIFDVCACASLPPVTSDAAASCGDGKCNGDETCRTCAGDCGECPKCELAPSCTSAVGVPSSPLVRGDLCQPPVVPDGGVSDAGAPSGPGTCKDPELRLRIERVLVHKGGGEIYCVVSATDGASSEAAVTAKTKSLGDNEANYFDATTGLYWGQKDLHATSNNLTVTFNCFVVKGDSWAKVLKAVGDTATGLGGTPTPYGWAFGLGGVAANAAAAGVAAGAGDELRFNAQQTIDKKELLDLTNGRSWSLRKSGGCGAFCNWDWEIFVQSWGCADAQTAAH